MREIPDLGLIEGEAVVVVRPRASYDDIGEPTYGEPEREEVAGCLVVPGATADLDASRPNGARVAYTVHFPKGYARGLRGCSLVVRGEQLEVVGDPQRHGPANVPGPWNMAAEAGWSDG